MTVIRDAVRTATEDPGFLAALHKQGAKAAYLDAPQFQRYWEADASRLISAMQKIGPLN